jgi:flagellum-specific peptidoglycan hydrolase FlgJ
MPTRFLPPLFVALLAGALFLALPGMALCQEKPPKPNNEKEIKAAQKALQKAAKENAKNAAQLAAKKAADRDAKKEADAQKAAKLKAERAAIEDMKVKEAEVLRRAYIVMAGANHDYDGHRAKAMNHLESAVRLLEDAVAKKGSNLAKLITEYDDAVAARAKNAQMIVAPVHENQVLSDTRLKKAAVFLAELRPTAIQLKQMNVTKHLDNAIKEVEIALEIR